MRFIKSFKVYENNSDNSDNSDNSLSITSAINKSVFDEKERRAEDLKGDIMDIFYDLNDSPDWIVGVGRSEVDFKNNQVAFIVELKRGFVKSHGVINSSWNVDEVEDEIVRLDDMISQRFPDGYQLEYRVEAHHNKPGIKNYSVYGSYDDLKDLLSDKILMKMFIIYIVPLDEL